MSGTAVLGRLFQSSLICKVKSGVGIMFNKHLLLTNLGISVSLSVAGDFLQQRYAILNSNDRNYDYRRTFNMGVTGCTLGFLCHHWYIMLDKALPGRTWAVVWKKVILDQLICSPLLIGSFFATLYVLERKSAEKSVAELKDKSWRLYLAEWTVWPLAQVINFSVLPTKYRIVYDNTISLGYDVYTSYIYNELPPPPDPNSDEDHSHKQDISIQNQSLPTDHSNVPVPKNS